MSIWKPVKSLNGETNILLIILEYWYMYLCFMVGRVEQTLFLLPNRTRENWVACGIRGKNLVFWPFICCSYKVISTVEIEPVFLSPKNVWQFNWIWHWKCICKFTKTLGLLIPTDFRCRQYVQAWGNLEKQKEQIKICVPHPKAAVCRLPSYDP